MPAKLERCKQQVKQRLIDKYKDKYDKEPSEKKKKEFESSAWAICRTTLKEGGD